MKGDRIIQTQLFMAQAFNALTDAINNSTGYVLTPVAFASRPDQPAPGSLACINDSDVAGWGEIISGGGFNTVIAFYNGTQWKVLGA